MAQRHSGLSERSNLVVSVSTEVETGTTSSPPQKIKVVVCFIKIPPKSAVIALNEGGCVISLGRPTKTKNAGGECDCGASGFDRVNVQW